MDDVVPSFQLNIVDAPSSRVLKKPKVETKQAKTESTNDGRRNWKRGKKIDSKEQIEEKKKKELFQKPLLQMDDEFVGVADHGNVAESSESDSSDESMDRTVPRKRKEAEDSDSDDQSIEKLKRLNAQFNSKPQKTNKDFDMVPKQTTSGFNTKKPKTSHDNKSTTEKKQSENTNNNNTTTDRPYQKVRRPGRFELIQPPKEQEEDYTIIENHKIFGNKFDSFAEMELHKDLVSFIKDSLKYEKPTLIQQLAVPFLIKNSNDVLIKAETGSGKTFTYLLPLYHKLLQRTIRREQGTYALITAPTRELCQQIFNYVTKLQQKFHWIVPGLFVGGEKRESEKQRLRKGFRILKFANQKGITVLVATPGRLLDHLRNTNALNFENLSFLVMDEADRLLDMGFEKQIREILQQINTKANFNSNLKPYQTLLISATLDTNIRNLAVMALKNPKFICTDPEENMALTEAQQSESNGNNNNDNSTEKYHIPEQLEQFFSIVDTKEKLVVLAAFVRWKILAREHCKIMAFFSNIDSVEFHHALFEATKIPPENVDSIPSKDDPSPRLLPIDIYKLHGNMSQLQRSQTFNNFNTSKRALLLATDVVARGVDFPEVDWIVQYDPPPESKEYIHRVGRAGRLGKKGHALLFLSPAEKEYAKILKDKGLNLNEMPVASILKTMSSTATLDFEGTSPLQLHFERTVLQEEKLMAFARKAFASSVKAYSIHGPETRHIFNNKKLHLGHLAKSFGLREPPSQVIANLRGERPGKRVDKKVAQKSDKMHNAVYGKKQAPSSEFSAF